MIVNFISLLWKNRLVEYPRRYAETTVDGAIKHEPAPGVVIEKGTPFTAQNMNRIEKGIADCAEAVNEKCKQAVYTATLPADGWTGSAAPFTKTITVSGILADDTPIIDIVQTGNYLNDVKICDSWSAISRAVTGANTLTFTADALPTVSIPIQVRCIRNG